MALFEIIIVFKSKLMSLLSKLSKFSTPTIVLDIPTYNIGLSYKFIALHLY